MRILPKRERLGNANLPRNGRTELAHRAATWIAERRSLWRTWGVSLDVSGRADLALIHGTATTGPLLGTPHHRAQPRLRLSGPPIERKIQSEAKKAAAEAEKQRRKCADQGNWPCSPTVTLSWTPYNEYWCYGVVPVTGFAPGPYGWTVYDVQFPESGTELNDHIVVGADGTGTQVSAIEDVGIHFYEGDSWIATVNGVDSAPSLAAC